MKLVFGELEFGKVGFLGMKILHSFIKMALKDVKSCSRIKGISEPQQLQMQKLTKLKNLMEVFPCSPACLRRLCQI